MNLIPLRNIIKSMKADEFKVPMYQSKKVLKGVQKEEQYLAVLEDLSKKRRAEDESAALTLDGEVTECSDQETDSQTAMEDNPVHKE
ncbi:hypothetical protein AVEN_71138-1 [Araneus ventricosus]|uniref:Uncharacterized protein n=1 Tax=Araneus ventricosus TaxID=182803 RepID=A0A4Y2KWG1_ARAVE|nr:hypothetical protein AVEN_71138-1 [Araneus ventricosus]